MLRACRYGIFFLMLLAVPASAVDVLDGCREVSLKGTLLLLDLSCKTAVDCWPDPDDVDLVDAKTGKITGWAVNDMVWLDAAGAIIDAMPNTYPVRAIWDMSSVGETLPGKVRLEFDDEDLTADITLKNTCRHIPKEILTKLGVGDKKTP